MTFFHESSEQSQIRSLARKFAQSEILPQIHADEATETFRPEWIRKMGSLGLTGIPVNEKWGGAGLGYQEYTIALEEIAQASAAYAISVAVTGLPQLILSQFGNDQQRAQFIPPLAAGEAIGSFSLSEASSGSDAASLKTTAKKSGDHYVLNGTKLWVTQADVAEIILLMARTGEKGPKGISTFIVPRNSPGLRFGKREKKMGLNTSHTMELVLENVKIPASHLVGHEGEGFTIAMTALDSGRITIAATALGLAMASLSVAIQHARIREQFGKPIGEFQGVSFMIADMKTQIEAARLLIQRAASLKDEEKPYSIEASMAKLFSTDMAMRVTTDAVQILGGSGYTQEFPVERYMREAKVLQIVEGTNQIQRLVIGRHLLKENA